LERRARARRRERGGGSIVFARRVQHRDRIGPRSARGKDLAHRPDGRELVAAARRAAARCAAGRPRERARARLMRLLGRASSAAAAAVFALIAYAYLTLPDVRPLKTTNPSTTAFMALREQEAHAHGVPARHVQRWVVYSRISPHLKRAVLVAEDDAFWQHE